MSRRIYRQSHTRKVINHKSSFKRYQRSQEKNGGIGNKTSTVDFCGRIRAWRGFGPVGNSDSDGGGNGAGIGSIGILSVFWPAAVLQKGR